MSFPREQINRLWSLHRWLSWYHWWNWTYSKLNFTIVDCYVVFLDKPCATAILILKYDIKFDHRNIRNILPIKIWATGKVLRAFKYVTFGAWKLSVSDKNRRGHRLEFCFQFTTISNGSYIARFPVRFCIKIRPLSWNRLSRISRDIKRNLSPARGKFQTISN